MEKICWLTDVHLNFLDEEERFLLYQDVRKANSNAVLLTGDIAEAPSVIDMLEEFTQQTTLPLYFVLGNHDYYKGSVEDVRNMIQAIVQTNQQLIWLGDGQIIELKTGVILIGQDTWADGRNGDYINSPVRLNDSVYILDLFKAASISHSELQKKMQLLADNDANQLEISLKEAIKKSPKKILIACHVPPFSEASWHIDKPSNKDFLPFFSCKVIGDLLTHYAESYPDILFEVYCGHTHTAHEYQASHNLIVHVGGSEYFHPKISEVVKL